MADVVLVNPDPRPGFKYRENDVNIDVPTSLLCLGTVLDANDYKVKMIDCRFEENFKQKMLDEAKDARVVGLTCMSAQIKQAIELSDALKEKDIPTVWGGVHPSLFPVQTCEDKAVDYVVVGEGDYTMLELVQKLEKGESVKDIQGIAYKDENGKVKVNPERPFLNMDELPPTAWHLVDVEKYAPKFIEGKHVRRLTFHGSRGCPHRCSFCINTIISKRRWRCRNIQLVLDEVQLLREKYNITYTAAREENFFPNKERVRAFCQGLLDRGIDIEWEANIRIDYINENHISNEFLDLMYRSGCRHVNFGAESGSDRILELIKKDIKASDMVRSAEMFYKHKITPLYSFMIGFPGETREDMIKTCRMMEAIKKACPTALFNGPQVFRPYPGGDLYDECKRLGFKEPQTLRAWPGELMEKIGYMSAYEMPWIQDPEFVEGVEIYGVLALMSDEEARKNLMTRLGVAISKWRWKNNFYKWPWADYGMYVKMRQLIKGF